MTSTAPDRKPLPSHYIGCPKCWKPLSIAEQIERHCEECMMNVQPKEIGTWRAA